MPMAVINDALLGYDMVMGTQVIGALGGVFIINRMVKFGTQAMDEK